MFIALVKSSLMSTIAFPYQPQVLAEICMWGSMNPSQWRGRKESSRIREGMVTTIIIASTYQALTMCQALFSVLFICLLILAHRCTMSKLLFSSLSYRWGYRLREIEILAQGQMVTGWSHDHSRAGKQSQVVSLRDFNQCTMLPLTLGKEIEVSPVTFPPGLSRSPDCLEANWAFRDCPSMRGVWRTRGNCCWEGVCNDRTKARLRHVSTFVKKNLWTLI